MSARRIAGPGKKVSTGHLRVDTARAVQKLREYQLAEPESWVLEVLRAAITLGASRLAVAGDGGEVIIAWEGGLLTDDTMRTVLDELVNPGEPRHEGAIRRLATGLNTALGLLPKRVDIERTDATGARTRVRYTSDLLDSPALGEDVREAGAGLTNLTAETLAPAEPGAPAGMRVVMKRRTGFDTFRRFLGRAEPEELQRVRECADDVPVPLHIAGDVLDRDTSPHDLVRIPLAAGLEGFVALVDADSTAAGNQPAWVDFAERGVILTREPLPLPAVWQDPRVSVPIRLFLDRQSLPTNASRSAVRMDDALRTALDVAAERVPRLLEETHRLLLGEASELAVQPTGARAEAGSRQHRLRKAVLHLIAAYVRGKPWRFDADTMPGGLQPLMALPLLRDAVGEPASVLDFWDSGGVLVYRGATPLSAERYGDTLRKLPFIPAGDAASVLLPEGTYDSEKVNQLLARAAEQSRARATFLEGATTAPVIPSSDHEAWVVVPVRAARADSFVAHEPLPPRDIEGEVALHATSGTARGRITLLHLARPIEELLVAGPCSFHAVVTCPRFTPTLDYRGVEDDSARREAISAVERAVLVAAELAAGVALGEGMDVDGARTLRGAPPGSGLTPEHARALEGAHVAAVLRADEHPYCEASPLARVRCIPVLLPSGERRDESALEVVARGRETQALLYRVGRGKQPPGAYPLALLDTGSVACLATLAGVRAARVDAGSRSGPWVPHVEADVVLRVRGEGFLGEIGWGDVEPTWTLYRDGAALEKSPLTPHILPAAVHIDDSRVVVDGETGKVALRPNHHELLFVWEQALLGALVAAARGDVSTDLRLRRATDVPRQLSRAMALAPRPFRKHFDRDYRHLSDALELPTARGKTITLAKLRTKKITWSLLPGARIDFDHPEFEPVVVDNAWGTWLETLLGRPLRDGSEQQQEFARKAGGAARREQVMAKAKLPTPVGDDTDPFARTVKRREFSGVLHVANQPPLVLTLTVDGRPLAETPTPLDLPFRGQLDVPANLVDAAWDSLSDAGGQALGSLLRDELDGFLVALGKAHPATLLSPRGEALVNAWGTLRSGRKGDARVREALSHARAWPSVQGPAVSLLDAKRRGRIHAAVFEGPWLGPQKGERKAQQDHAVIVSQGPVADSPLARFAELVDVGPLTDTTHAVQQLQARRRVEQGTSELPRLGHPDAIAMTSLLKDDPRLLAGLGLGEARLSLDAQGSNPSTAFLHALGKRVGSQALAVFPPVELAFEASGYLPDGKGTTLDKRKLSLLTQRVQRLAGKLVTRSFQRQGAHLPLQQATRSAWLVSKALEDDVVTDLPLLDTTAGQWTSLSALRSTAGAQGVTWFTTDLTSRVVPEEADRPVLRLTPAEAQVLGAKLPLEDATETLAMQSIRVANKARPKATSLDARDALAARSERAAAATLAFADFEPDGSATGRGSLVVLTPDAAQLAGLHVHRELHPLGTENCPTDWPTLIVADDPALTPNVRYDAPKKDATWDRLVEQVHVATIAALRVRFDPGDDFGARRVDVKLLSGTLGVGVVGLGDPLLPSELVVTREHRQALREFPLRGELWTCLPRTRGSRDGVGVAETLAITKGAYTELLLDAANALARVPLNTKAPGWARDASSWSEDELDLARAHLVLGAVRGLLPPIHTVLDSLTLACFRPLPITLRSARDLVTGHRPVYLVEPDGPDAHGADPVLVADDSLVSRTLAMLLGGRLRRAVVRPVETEAPDTRDRSTATASAERAPTAPHALAGLADELAELLSAVVVRGGVRNDRVSISPRRAQPLMTVDPDGQRVVLAGKHPTLLRVAAELAEDDPSTGRRAVFALAAHALAILDDAGPRESRIDHLSVIQLWLTPAIFSAPGM